jgi:hypothetical protein
MNPPTRSRSPSPPVSPVVIIEKPKNDTIMGAPIAALKIIIVNMIIVSLIAAVVYLLGGGDLKIMPIMAFTFLGLMLFQLALQFIFWKLYWWLLGLAWSCITFMLIAALIGVATGAISLDRLAFYRYGF